MGRSITVMYGVCKKEVFDIPTTMEWRKVKSTEKVWNGQQGCRAVGEDIPWQLCVESDLVCPWFAWVGGLGQCMHIQVSVVLQSIYVQYRYVRAEELSELRRRRMFFREVTDLFRMTLMCSVHRKSYWKTMPRCRCFQTTVSSCLFM